MVNFVGRPLKFKVVFVPKMFRNLCTFLRNFLITFANTNFVFNYITVSNLIQLTPFYILTLHYMSFFLSYESRALVIIDVFPYVRFIAWDLFLLFVR